MRGGPGRESDAAGRKQRDRVLLGDLAVARRRGDPEGALGVVERLLRPSVDFEVRAFRRQRAQLAAREELREPAGVPQLPAEPAPTPIEQAEALSAVLFVLSWRDRQVLIEREVLDLSVRLIAERHRMSLDAVRQVSSRALSRLRRENDKDAQPPDGETTASVRSFPRSSRRLSRNTTRFTIKEVEESGAQIKTDLGPCALRRNGTGARGQQTTRARMRLSATGRDSSIRPQLFAPLRPAGHSARIHDSEEGRYEAILIQLSIRLMLLSQSFVEWSCGAACC